MSMTQIPLLLLLCGFLASVFLGMAIIPRILVISHKKRLYDIPDTRKVHTTPVPRLGGLSFFPVILMSMALVMLSPLPVGLGRVESVAWYAL